MKNTIVLTGGGTAGHVMPNILLKSSIEKEFEKIVYIGSKDGIEKKLVASMTNYDYYPITTVKFNRQKILANFKIPCLLRRGIKEAKKILKDTNPSIVFSKGGYVGLPVVIAAHKLKIPVVCHESDLSMGLANKIAKKYAEAICTNFSETASSCGAKGIHTGSPIKLSNLTKSEAKDKLKINTTKPVLLVIGGSLGAKALNTFIYENLDEITKKYFVIHIVGNGNTKNINNVNYKQIEFANNMPEIYRASDFALSRAGANTVFELLANNVLSVFVPLPKAASRGDQIENANYVTSKGLAKTIPQDELTAQKLQNTLILLEKDAKTIKNNLKSQNFTDASKNIMKVLNEKKLKI